MQKNCPEHLPAFLDLIPTAFKADLLRACVLYTDGGVYVDDDIAVSSLDVMLADAHHSALLVQDRDVNLHHGAWNAFMVARPKQPFLKCTMDAISDNVANHRVKFHGDGPITNSDVLHVSGPGAVSDCIGETDDVQYR